MPTNHQGAAKRVERVLIVDDESHVRLFLRKVLVHLGFHEAVEAGTSEEAIEAVQGGEVGLVILDLNLPGVTGMELLEQIRELDAAVPVIVVSAQTQATVVKACVEAGADGYVVKTLPRDQLIAELQGIVEDLFGEE